MTYPSYTGRAGRTRVERVRVFRAEGDPLEVEVFRVLNVEEHPELAGPALDGTLHRLSDGQHVDVPFVYHDPVRQHFVLVVPHAAHARELSERARLLEALMAEPADAVPEYVRRFEVVHGRDGLARFVESAETIDVEANELEPFELDGTPSDYYPRTAALLPSAGFGGRWETELATLLDDAELWLFARLKDDECDAFTEETADLLIQLKVVDRIPVTVLTLSDVAMGVHRRAYANPARSADGRILEALRRDFQAKVVVYDERGELVRSFRVEAPRSSNAAAIVERTLRSPVPPRHRWEHVLEICRQVPPPLFGFDHPFVAEESARDARTALERLRRVEAWSTPEQLERVITLASVPIPALEVARRRAVAEGVRFGLAMSTTLLLQAVRFGLAPDVDALLATLHRRFEELVAGPASHGLGEHDIRQNRVALARLAERHRTSTRTSVSCTMQASG